MKRRCRGSPASTSAGSPGPPTATATGDGEGAADTGRLGLKAAVATHLGEIDAREINSIPHRGRRRRQAIVVRVGRYGPYLQRGDDRASIPDDLAPDELTIERAEELLAAPSGDRELGTDPESGLAVLVEAGRFGPYVQLGEAVDGGAKPRTASLFASMAPATVTFDEALELLRIPRVGRARSRDRRGDRRPQRAVRPVLEARHRHPEPDQRGPAPDGRPSTRPWPSSPSPRPGAAGPRPHRYASSAPTPKPGRRWCCARAGSGRT